MIFCPRNFSCFVSVLHQVSGVWCHDMKGPVFLLNRGQAKEQARCEKKFEDLPLRREI